MVLEWLSAISVNKKQIKLFIKMFAFSIILHATELKYLPSVVNNTRKTISNLSSE